MCIDDNINKVKGASGKLEEKRVYLAMEMSIQEWKGGFVLKKGHSRPVDIYYLKAQLNR